MARGSSQSEAGDRLRLKADYKTAEAARLRDAAANADRLDAEKQAKAAAKEAKQAKNALKDPATFVEKVKLDTYKDMYGRVIVNPKVGDEGIDIGNNGYERNKITNRSFGGINSKFEPLLREEMIDGIKKMTGMSEKKAAEAADRLTERIRKEIGGDLPTPLQYVENAKNRESELADATRSKERFESLRRSREYAEGRDYDGDNAIAAAAKEHGLESTARYWKEDLIPALKNIVAKSGGFESASAETVAWANSMLKVALPQARADFKQAKWKTTF
jgi:hypothetical protein